MLLFMNERMQRDLNEEFDWYNRVKIFREDLGITRQEMADALGIAYRTLGYIEREDYKPSLDLAYRISLFLEVPLEAVFSPEPFRSLGRELYGGGNTTQEEEAS